MTRSFLVPIQLPADPTAALQAATKQYVDARVVASPAECGPRASLPTQARFGNTAESTKALGFFSAADGSVFTIAPTGVPFGWWEVVGGTPTQVGGIQNNLLYTQVWKFGQHPNLSNTPGIWLNGSDAAANVIINANTTTSALNAGSTVCLRIGNVNYVVLDNNAFQCARRVSLSGDTPGVDWSTANICIAPGTSGQQAKVAFQSPGVAPILRTAASLGENIGCVNSANSAYAPLWASAFTVNSTATAKRGIRSLRERDFVPVEHDAMSDEVSVPDVMSLRTVAFRPKVGALRIVPTGDGPVDANDRSSWEFDDQVGILGHEGQRERLGLIAEEVETVLPSAVSHDEDGNAMGIDYAQITVALLDHVQRLTEEVATLRYRITELEGTA